MNKLSFHFIFVLSFCLPSSLFGQPITRPENRISTARLEPYAAYFASVDAKEGDLGNFNIGNKKINCHASQPMADKNIAALPSTIESYYRAYSSFKQKGEVEIEFANLRTDLSSRLRCRFDFINPISKISPTKETLMTADDLIAYFNEVAKQKHEDIHHRLRELIKNAKSGDSRPNIPLNGVDESGLQNGAQQSPVKRPETPRDNKSGNSGAER